MPEFELELGPFGGLNNRVEAAYLKPTDLQLATEVQAEQGALTGWEAPAASGTATNQNQTNWIGYAASTWQASIETRYALADSDKLYATRQGARPIVYRADNTSHSLGVAAPDALMWTSVGDAGTLGGVYSYSLTFLTADGLESNQLTATVTLTLAGGTNTVTFTNTTSSDPRVTARKLWRTSAGGSTLYLLRTIQDNTTDTIVDNGSVSLGTAEITWGVGGYPSATSGFTADHSVPPALTVLSDAVHGVMGQVGVSGSGILFGAQENTVRWSALGYPDYWPTVNSFPLADRVEAITSEPGFSAVFTASSIYVFSGTSDDALDTRQSAARVYPKAGSGKCVKRTQYGTLFLAREGLGVFNGTSSELWGSLHPAFVGALVPRDAAYFDRRYYVFCSSMGRPSTTVTVTAGGSGYTTAPSVTFSLPQIPGGRQTKGFATLSNGAVASVTITEQGFGYTTTPTITFSSGAATATTALEVGTLICDLTNGLANAVFTTSGQDVVCAWVTDFAEPSVAVARRDLSGYYDGVPTYTTNTQVGYKHFALATDGAATPTIWVGMGTTYTVGNTGSAASAQIYEWSRGTNNWTIQTADDAARTLVRGSYGSSGGSNFIYCYGGISAVKSPSWYSNMAVYNTGTDAWGAVVDLANDPGEKADAAQAITTTGVLYVLGGHDNTGAVSGTIHSYTGGTAGTWDATLTNVPTAVTGAAACWVPGAKAGNTGGVIVVFGGTTATTGTVKWADPASVIVRLQVYNIDTDVWDVNDVVTPAQAGVAARCGHDMVYDATTGLVWLHGGQGADGSLLADLWAFDPTNVTTTAPVAADWAPHTSAVLNLAAREGHRMVVVAGRLFVFGGKTDASIVNRDLWEIPLATLTDNTSVPGVYVVTTAAQTTLVRWTGGARQAWVAKLADLLGGTPSTYKTLIRGWIDYEGAVTVRTVSDNDAVVTAKSLSSATRAQTSFWFPSATRGQRIALQIEGAAASGATPVGKVYSMRVRGREDGEPRQ